MRHTTLCLAVALSSLGCARPSATDRAIALVRQHREAAAAAVLRERLAARPDDVGARRLLIRVLALAGDMVEARGEVDALARRLPSGDATALIELGHALELAHRYDEALAAYDDAALRATSAKATVDRAVVGLGPMVTWAEYVPSAQLLGLCE